jgi:hypothetical protein
LVNVFILEVEDQQGEKNQKPFIMTADRCVVASSVFISRAL